MGKVSKIDYDTMKKIVNSKSHVIINALSKDSFERCPIPNSINIPLLSVDKNNAVYIIREHLKSKKKGKLYETPIVVYCKDKGCNASERLIKKLSEYGFKDLSEYSEGVLVWMKKSKSKCVDQSGGKSTESEESSKESEESEEPSEESEEPSKEKSKSSKTKNEYNLSGDFETVVFDGNKYQHDLKTKDILKKGQIIGEYVGDKIIFKEVDEDSSDEENDDYTSSEDEDVRDESDYVKESTDIKYRKHKLKLVCMNEITPKIYDKQFRGWGFTFWY